MIDIFSIMIFKKMKELNNNLLNSIKQKKYL